MKAHTSFSSLPTGVHLFLGTDYETEFLFVNIEKNESVESTEAVMATIQSDLALEGSQQEQQHLSAGIVANKVESMALKMRKEALERAKVQVDAELTRLGNSFNQKLVEIYAARAGSSNIDSIQKWLQGQVKNIDADINLTKAEKDEKKLALIKPLRSATEAIEKKDPWVQRVIQSVKQGAQEYVVGSEGTKTRVNNGVGFGLVTWYLTGVFGGKPLRSLLVGGIAAGAAGVAPVGVSWLLKGGDAILGGVGYGLKGLISHTANGLMAVARMDLDYAWDGQTAVNKKRTEVLGNLSGKNIEKPKLKGENGEMLITESLHAKILNPSKVETLSDPEYKERSERAAQFCVEMMDPSLLLIQDKITPEQKELLMNLDKFSTWDSKTLELIKRTFATREAVLIWNYFLLFSDKEKELAPFTKAFGAGYERKRLREMGMTDAEKKADAQKKLADMYPDINDQMSEKTKEGIASFMKDGGLEDVLVAGGTTLLMVYGLLLTMEGVRIGKEKGKQLIKWLRRPEIEKYKKRKEKATTKLPDLLDNSEATKDKNWKKILTTLEGMSILSKKEQGKLEKSKNVSKSQRGRIIESLKGKDLTTTEMLSSIREKQNIFWEECVRKAGFSEDRIANWRDLEMGKDVNKKENTPSSTVEVAKRKINLFHEMVESYNTDYKTMNPKALDFYRMTSKKLSSFWNRLKDKNVGTSKIKMYKEIAKDFFGKKNDLLRYMNVLGVHENEIDLCKDISKKKGAQNKMVMTMINELWTLRNENTKTP